MTGVVATVNWYAQADCLQHSSHALGDSTLSSLWEQIESINTYLERFHGSMSTLEPTSYRNPFYTLNLPHKVYPKSSEQAHMDTDLEHARYLPAVSLGPRDFRSRYLFFKPRKLSPTTLTFCLPTANIVHSSTKPKPRT